MEFDALSRQVIGCALQVHSTLGPGLLESTCQRCLAIELAAQNIPFEEQVGLLINFNVAHLERGIRRFVL